MASKPEDAVTDTEASDASRLAVVVLAAGKGTRMRSTLPKMLHPLAGQPMVQHVLNAARGLDPERMVVVIGPDMPEVAAAVAPADTAVQEVPRGTGDALRAAGPALAGYDGDVLMCFGDTPLLTTEILAEMVAARRADGAPDLLFAGMVVDDPTGYGRMLLAGDSSLAAIVEERDASAEEKAIRLCNAGMLIGPAATLFHLLGLITDENAQGEFYVTDLAEIAALEGLLTGVVEVPEEAAQGVNSRGELAMAEARLQDRLRARALDGGTTLIDPATIYLSTDTVLGRDVTIGPNVVIAPGVTIADGVTVKAFCHLEGVAIEEGAIIGPFARLRPGSTIGTKAVVGNFVEVKAATIGAGAKANHLAYIGDASVGAASNIGAGTITCNYDGVMKHRTEIGAGTFIGSNSTLVAPVTIGDGAYVGAGSTITESVPSDALALGRGRQVNKDGRGQEIRQRLEMQKKVRAGHDANVAAGGIAPAARPQATPKPAPAPKPAVTAKAKPPSAKPADGADLGPFRSFVDQARHYFKRAHTSVPTSPVETEAAWVGPEMAKDPGQWRIDLAEVDAYEITLAARHLKETAKPLAEMTARDFPLPTLGKEIAKWRETLETGRGFVVVRGLPMHNWDDELAQYVFWGMGHHLGVPGAQNPQDELLGHVTDYGEDDPTARLYRTASKIDFHCDAADIVGLMCLRAAKSGGDSRIASSVTIFNRILAERPDLAPRLFEPFKLDLRGEQRPGQAPTRDIAPCAFADGRLSTFWHSEYLRSATRHEGVALSAAEQELIDLYDSLAASPDLHLDMALEPGDMQFISNHVTVHSRTAYEDWEEPNEKRHLLRLWLSFR